MDKIYQPEIKNRAKKIVSILREINFFEEFEISDETFAYTHFCDKITEKFILGETDIESDELFTENEFDKCLNEIIVESCMLELKTKGVVNSYENEEGEEFFFLTEEGKKIATTLIQK